MVAGSINHGMHDNMELEGCICCSRSSIKIMKKTSIPGTYIVKDSNSQQLKTKFLVCNNCGKMMCLYCASHICSLIKSTAEKNHYEKDIILKDIWYATVIEILNHIHTKVLFEIKYGSCCSFSASVCSHSAKPSCTVPCFDFSNTNVCNK
jgi:hypothetical protein